MAEPFSLKDALFNKTKLVNIADEIHAVYNTFPSDEFVSTCLAAFPELELKQRIVWIRKRLQAYLPPDYRKAVTVLLQALPAANDHTKTDNDFGDFIYAPYNDFVAAYGRTRQDVAFSLEALKEITMRFSAEDAIRYFINDFPNETFHVLEQWTHDSHYHVRRLVSEGTRPKLPWSVKITIPIEKPIPLLDNLFHDRTRYVTRSVANHLNDISKFNPDLVLETLERWQTSEKQDPKEMEYIIKHSLRTLVKLGNKKAIEFLHFSAEPEVEISQFEIKKTTVRVGEALDFSFDITAKKDERLILDYIIYFVSKAGTLTNKKVFKIKQCTVKKGETHHIHKRHPLRVMTTRVLYPGKHTLEIQINGTKVAQQSFVLVS